MKTCDVAIVGAGVVGAACAYELASAGLRVVVVEPNAIASGATSLAYGTLSIGHDVPGQFELTRFGLELWNKLSDYLPAECEYKRDGSIWVAINEIEMKEAVRRAEFFIQQGLEVDLLVGRELAQLEPGLRSELGGGLYVAADGWVRPAKAAEFLLQLAARSGAETLARRAVAIAEHEVLLDDDSVLFAGNIINAAGRHASELTPSLPLELSKGHLMVVDSEADCVHHSIATLVVEREAAADAMVRLQVRQSELGPNRRRELWIGSSYQPVPQETAGDLVSTQVEPRIIAVLLRRAIDMLPVIGRAKPLRSWTGLRSGTLDGLPLIGRVRGKESIFAAAGHASYGATTALATAKLIAAEILARTPEIDPKPYLANRFEGEK